MTWISPASKDFPMLSDSSLPPEAIHTTSMTPVKWVNTGYGLTVELGTYGFNSNYAKKWAWDGWKMMKLTNLNGTKY